MKVRFWGVRGSIPTPLTSEKMLSRIQAVVEKISPKDLKNQDTKQAFISSLPEYITGVVGGNSSCVELRCFDDEVFIMDCGSGIRELGKVLAKEGIKKIHIFLSHFHWDHIQGLPFFDPIYIKDCEIHFYSVNPNVEKLLTFQMKAPYFPVEFENCQAKMHFHVLKEGQEFSIRGIKINTKELNHPNRAFAYSFINEKGTKFVYATDTELKNQDFEDILKDTSFYKNADLIVFDAQYTVPESIAKENWGHSSFCYAIDFANICSAKRICLFHHEPLYDDRTIYDIYEHAKLYAKSVLKTKMEVILAREQLKLEL